MDRTGRTVTAKENNYKRIYADDGSNTYPRLPENRLRVKSEPYFKKIEIYSIDGKNKKEPNLTLLPYYRNILFVRLHKSARELSEKARKVTKERRYFNIIK